MIHSMTGFARQQTSGEWGELTCELRAVNHRYLDPHFRLPEDLRAVEPRLRELTALQLARGKLECQLRYRPSPTSGDGPLLDEELTARLAEAVDRVASHLSSAAPVDPMAVLSWPGVVREGEPDLEPLRETARRLFAEALDELVASRRAEGQRIRGVLEDRLEAAAARVATIRERLPSVREALRQRLDSRLAELGAEPEPGRLEQELAVQVQKMDIAEELDRLDSHIAETRDTLAREEPVGRRLDFLMQELNREANTIASKTQDTDTTRDAVELKVLIEQMREQVQNVE